MRIDTQFQTPPAVAKYMAEMIPNYAITIYEPTPGLGNIVNAVKERYALKEISVPSNDFFKEDKRKFDCIIGNPPFSSKSAFMDNAPDGVEVRGMKLGYYILKQCMEMSDNVIMLMPWFTISDSDVRLRFLKNYGLKSLTALPRKTFEYARIQTVIIELEKGYAGDTLFKVFEF